MAYNLKGFWYRKSATLNYHHSFLFRKICGETSTKIFVRILHFITLLKEN